MTENVTLYNINGQRLNNTNALINGHLLELSLANLPVGVYWVKIQTAQGIASARVVKAKK